MSGRRTRIWTVADVDDDDLLAVPGTLGAPPHRRAQQRVGTGYWPDSNINIGVFAGTTRVVPIAGLLAGGLALSDAGVGLTQLVRGHRLRGGRPPGARALI